MYLPVSSEIVIDMINVKAAGEISAKKEILAPTQSVKPDA